MIPTCVDFWIWVASGVFIVPLLEGLKKLPTVGPVASAWAWLLAPLLSAIAPVLASVASPHCGQIDPMAWIAIYAGVTYLVSQLVFWVGVKTRAIRKAELESAGK